MTTLCISGGRKQKVSPGDIPGALISKVAITGINVGKIDIFDFWSYVSVKRNVAGKAFKRLKKGRFRLNTSC